MKIYLSDDTMEQFEIVNTLGLDLDSFELQSYLDPNKQHKYIMKQLTYIEMIKLSNRRFYGVVWIIQMTLGRRFLKNLKQTILHHHKKI